MATSLTPQQELEAKLLEDKIRFALENEIAELARLLVSKKESEIFGQTEFQVRDLVLRMGAKALQEHLREKKTAMPDPPSNVEAVAKPPNSKGIEKSIR